MTSLLALPRRSLATAIPFLALLAVVALGGCSVTGGVTGSIGHAGARVGANVDFTILDAAIGYRTQPRYEVETVYVVPNHKASP